MVAGPDGAVWFTAGLTGKIGRITTGGSLTEYSTGSSSSGPQGIAAGPDGMIWFAETSSNKIGRISTAGVLTEFAVPTPSSQPGDIAAGPDGALWFTERSGNKIGRITTTGQITEYSVPTASSGPAALEAGPDGAIWFTELTGGKVGRITTSGAVTEYAVPTASPWLEDIVVGPDGRMWFAELGTNKLGALAIPPGATTAAATAIDSAGATLSATLDPNGLTLSYHFEYGTSALYGQSTGTQSVSGAGTQAVALSVTGLAESTTYHYRVVATSAGGTITGADETFTTAAAPVVDPGPDTTTPPPDNPTDTDTGTGTDTGTDTTSTDTDKPTTDLGDPMAALSAKLIVPARVTVTRAGELPFTVACPAAAILGCHGSIKLALAAAKRTHATPKLLVVAARCARGCRPLGGSRYQVRRGSRGHVRAKLNRRGRAMLARSGTLRVQLTMTASAAGKTSIKRRTVVVKSRQHSRRSGS